ncbi:Acyl-CoA-binding domain-containing protein 4 [Madurella mycetomatis]|uniref:Acyl-CoA-binding domain-containing protein 4 n=1 Tax=Madurella mycetomatis TaxID=100816 RepID=A0A175W4R7_9PEZI|nr:Acyl-CoA-binding domain-containing protein 4 [Madurella mycetomatis]
MAGTVAAAIAAEQVVATGVEAAAAVAIAAPTLPLKVSLTQLRNPAPRPADHTVLNRSHHTLTVIDNKAIIFGGQDSSGKLCPPGIHTLTLPEPSSSQPNPAAVAGPADAAPYPTAYTCYPSFPLQDAATGEVLVPRPRSDHAACSRGGRFLLVHGGRGTDGGPVDEGNCLWQWDWENLSWAKLRGDSQLGVEMRPRWGHDMFMDEAQGFLVLVGGRGEGLETETWMYDFNALAWTTLPRVPARPLAAAYAGGKVYVVSRALGDGGGRLGGAVHFLDMRESPTEREKPGALVWKTVDFPANPLTPGPKPREGGALVPITTGYGRAYLVYMFGSSDDGEGKREYYSDVWTLQLPTKGFNPASAKDKVRKELPIIESDEFRWAEAEIVPTEQVTEEGKVHPGPRGLFGADSCLNGRGVVLWGGVNAKGEKEGDGWILRLAYGYADNDRWE